MKFHKIIKSVPAGFKIVGWPMSGNAEFVALICVLHCCLHCTLCMELLDALHCTQRTAACMREYGKVVSV